jgi:hypothetical protein
VHDEGHEANEIHKMSPLRVLRDIHLSCGALVPAGLFAALLAIPSLHAQTDLDAFMREVLAHRDDNWKKLQQYILDEREQIEIRGPSHQPVWGEKRDYTWYVRDGFFVRSPVRFNGADIGEADRRKYETEVLKRAQERDKRALSLQTPNAGSPLPGPQPPDKGAPQEGGVTSVDGLLRQVREPQFISSAYFLRFKFEESKYALVGREQFAGREVLRVEYYPTDLFTPRQRRRMARDPDPKNAQDAEIQRMFNKVALVTLWIDPSSHQIVKYTFDNVDLDFLPGRWLLRVDSLRATMTMSEAFPDVWLPDALEFSVAAEVATGQFTVRYALDYHDYRQADVTSKVHTGQGR